MYASNIMLYYIIPVYIGGSSIIIAFIASHDKLDIYYIKFNSTTNNYHFLQ